MQSSYPVYPPWEVPRPKSHHLSSWKFQQEDLLKRSNFVYQKSFEQKSPYESCGMTPRQQMYMTVPINKHHLCTTANNNSTVFYLFQLYKQSALPTLPLYKGLHCTGNLDLNRLKQFVWNKFVNIWLPNAHPKKRSQLPSSRRLPLTPQRAWLLEPTATLPFYSKSFQGSHSL
jgi:hypothetical protein